MRQQDKFALLIRNFIYRVCDYLNFALVIAIFIAILITMTALPKQLSILTDFNSESLITFLQYAINIVIAIEMIHVICKPSLDSVVEVLIIAVTRELIIKHFSMYETLIGILAIAVLFLIRKYLFIKSIDRDEPTNENTSPCSK